VVPPAQTLQVLAAQPVSVPDAARLAVARTVSLDGEHHPAWIVRVHSCEVDSVPADAVLRDHSDARVGQPFAHVSFEGVKLGGTGSFLSRAS
jgi:hypothetical protein